MHAQCDAPQMSKIEIDACRGLYTHAYTKFSYVILRLFKTQGVARSRKVELPEGRRGLAEVAECPWVRTDGEKGL